MLTPCPTRSSLIKLTTTPEDHRIAQLAAAAIGLSLIDAAIPLPLPGIKPGLANIVTLIVLARYGWASGRLGQRPARLRRQPAARLLSFARILHEPHRRAVQPADAGALAIRLPRAASGRSAGAYWRPLRTSAANSCWPDVADSA
jgi:hypothetical protein